MCQEVTLSEIRTVLIICWQKNNLLVIVALDWKMRTKSYADSQMLHTMIRHGYIHISVYYTCYLQITIKQYSTDSGFITARWFHIDQVCSPTLLVMYCQKCQHFSMLGFKPSMALQIILLKLHNKIKCTSSVLSRQSKPLHCKTYYVMIFLMLLSYLF